MSREEHGFTLVELMVVVLIIAILIAIAIPSFLGARSRAQDRAAQASLRNALSGEKIWYVDSEAYTDVIADLTATESGVAWQAVASAGPNEVYVRIDAADDQVVCLEAMSETGTTFVLADIASGLLAGTHYGTAALPACTWAAASALPFATW